MRSINAGTSISLPKFYITIENLDAPYRRYETRSLVNLSSGSQDLESRNTASFALGGFSSRGKTSSDEGMGFFSTNASLQAHGGSQSGLDTIIGGSSSFPPPNVDTQARISRGRLFVWISR